MRGVIISPFLRSAFNRGCVFSTFASTRSGVRRPSTPGSPERNSYGPSGDIL